MHHSKSTENRAKLQKSVAHKIVNHNVLSPLLFLEQYEKDTHFRGIVDVLISPSANLKSHFCKNDTFPHVVNLFSSVIFPLPLITFFRIV